LKWLDADFLSPGEGGYEPQRQNNALVEFFGVPGAEILRLSIRASDLPTLVFEEFEIPYQNSRRYIAQRFSPEAMTITYNDYLDPNTAGALVSWSNLVGVPLVEKINPPSVYKRDGRVVLFAPDGSSERVWRLLGCWPQSVNYGSVDMSATGIVQIEATIRVDQYVPGGNMVI